MKMKQFKNCTCSKKTEKLTPKSWGHNSVPPKHFHRFTIIFESGDTIVYHHTNQHPTLLYSTIMCPCGAQEIVTGLPLPKQCKPRAEQCSKTRLLVVELWRHFIWRAIQRYLACCDPTCLMYTLYQIIMDAGFKRCRRLVHSRKHCPCFFHVLILQIHEEAVKTMELS